MILIYAILAFAAYYISKTYIRPYLLYQTYKATKNCVSYYDSKVGFFGLLIQSLKEKGDILGYYKELAVKDPNVRMQVSNIGNRINLNILELDMIKEILANEHRYVKASFSAPTFGVLIGNGLLFTNGGVWKHHRKILNGFFNTEFLRSNMPMIVETTREYLDNIAKGDLNKVLIMDDLRKITGDVVGKVFFGGNLSGYSINGEPLTLYLTSTLAEAFAVDKDPNVAKWRRFGIQTERLKKVLQRVAEFRAFCMKIVQDRKKSGEKKTDMLGLLLETQKNTNKEEALSDQDIVDEFITFFAGGMDTTGNLIHMMLYELNRNPQHRKKLEEEASQIYNRDNYDTLSQMEFTDAFTKETQRFYNPSSMPVSRITVEEHFLGDIHIKKGVIVRPQPIYNYFNPRYFKDPEAFLPERWLDKVNPDPNLFIPFSQGERYCIGKYLAQIEAKVILSEFLKKFDFEIPKDYQLKMVFGFMYEPMQKIPLKLTLKKN